MLSHDNMLWTGKTMSHLMGYDRERIISYLPLNHVLAAGVDIFCGFLTISTIYFADKMALKGSLGATLKEVRPTSFYGVPRVFEKIMEGMMNKLSTATNFKQSLMSIFSEASVQHHTNRRQGLTYRLGKAAFYNKIKELIGLDQCRRKILCGGAPMDPGLLKFFLGLNIKLFDTYGTSETSGPATYYTLNNPIPGCAGVPLKGCSHKLVDMDDNGHGTLFARGRPVFMGYLNQEEKTKADFDSDGYFCTGDQAFFDSNGQLFITGTNISCNQNIYINNVHTTLHRSSEGDFGDIWR